MRQGFIASCIAWTVVTALLSILPGCSESSSGIKIKEQALAVAEDYAKKQLNNPPVVIMKDGTEMIGDTDKKYLIEPSKVFVGLIDRDKKPDAIVSVSSYKGYDLLINEHLIIINIEGKLTLVNSVESDMRIISVKDRIITADVPTHERSSPLFNCPKCREVIKYKYDKGVLVKSE